MRHMYNTDFFFSISYMENNVWLFLWGGGGGSGPLNNQTGPIVTSSCPLTHINLHGKYGRNVIHLFVYIEACILNKAFLFILF